MKKTRIQIKMLAVIIIAFGIGYFAPFLICRSIRLKNNERGNTTKEIEKNEDQELDCSFYLMLLPGEGFNEMSEGAKLSIYQKVVEYESRHLQLKKTPKLLFDREDGPLGCYNPELNEIHMQKAFLTESGSFATCTVLFHELYHAKQTQIITEKELLDDNELTFVPDIDMIKYCDDINGWTEEYNNYVSAEDPDMYEEYASQEIEVSADDYSESRTWYYLEQGYLTLD